MLRHIPRSVDPNLLVGIETSDDAGVFRLSDDLALVQTVDFFTPVVDDPYAYGQIAAANALSDVYAMGGKPLTVLNIACFSPSAAPPEVWADVIRGAFDKVSEAGAIVVGGHSVDDDQPKFGMAVTGVVDPHRMFANTAARPGDQIWLTKPLGSGIVTTAAKYDACPEDVLAETIEWMATLNRSACEAAQAVDARCATDVTGFGLAGHLFNVARGSSVRIELESSALPALPMVRRLITDGHVTGGAARNRAHLGEAFSSMGVEDWLEQLALDPQTSGGLAIFTDQEIPGAWRIGQVIEGDPAVVLRP